MGYAQKRPQRAVKLPSGFDATLWEELTYGDLKKIGQMGDEPTVDQADVMLMAMLASWNLTGEDETILEINESNLNLLSREDAETLISEVGKILEEGNQEKKDSPSPSSSPSTEPEQPPQS